MSDITANSSRMTTDASTQIRRLRREVEVLMRDAMPAAVADAFDRAANASQHATNSIRENAETVAAQVRGRPLVSIISAAFMGFVLGRASR
jgi:hypothetical protein